jgi:hypothetical protein
MASRRSVLIGLGSLVAGGGALLGTGAFTTVTAERTVNVQTEGDADAFLALAPADRDGDGNNEYVSAPGDDGTVEIDLSNSGDNSDGSASGLNQNAETTFRNLVNVTNNGTQEVTELELNMSVSAGPEGDSTGDITADETFHFTVTDPDGDDYEATFDNSDGNADNILTGNNDFPGSLESGDGINFGLIVDLLDGGNDNNALPEPGNIDYTLTITANTESDSS